MSRKTTKFSRKRQQTGGVFIRNSFINPILKCRPYTTEPIIGLATGETQSAADGSIKLVRGAFESLKAGTSPADSRRDYDLISHAIGVACIRAGKIAGTDPEENIMLPPLTAGNAARDAVLARHRKWGKWELIPSEVETLDYALEIYETIVRASSPAQMSEAVDLRREALKGRFIESLETT